MARAASHRTFLDYYGGIGSDWLSDIKGKVVSIIQRLKESKVLIAGLGMTGCSFARWLKAHNIAFDAWDSREKENVAVNSLFDQSTVYFAGAELPKYDYILISPGVDPRHANIVKQKLNEAVLLGDVALFNLIRKTDKSRAYPLIAITSSNGKSTVVDWCGYLFRNAGKKAIVAGNIGTPILDVIDAEPGTLFVLELSSFQLETIDLLSADIAVCLNITPDHLDRYDSYSDYKSAKLKIFQQAKTRIFPSNEEIELLEQSDVFAVMSNQMQPKLLRLTDDELEISLIGHHNLKNALIVREIGRQLNIGEDIIQSTLKSYKGLPHRCELIGSFAGVDYINDSKATNADAVKAALNGFNTKQVHLLLGGVSKDKNISTLRESINKAAKMVIYYGQDGQALSQSVEIDIESQLVDTLEHAVQLAAKFAAKGDKVLLSPACASFDEFDNFAHRGECFRKYVEAIHVH
jgi:UDP-N-acetylmuramoylalanine--D-glutamate ligase